MMVHHDEIMVQLPGGRDPKGFPIPGKTVGPYRVTIHPISSRDVLTQSGTIVTARYRMIAPKHVGEQMGTTSTVIWGAMRLVVDGHVENWRVNGRTHHYEATLRMG